MEISSLFLMRYELLMLAAIVGLILLKIFNDHLSRSLVAGVATAVLLGGTLLGFSVLPAGELFSGMYATGEETGLEKTLLCFATLLISLQAGEWLKNHKHFVEFYLLLFAVLLGMFLMISSGHFLMFYLGLEMATIPLAALAAFDFSKARSSEAGMKMILSSAFSSAVLLFGISLVYGTTGALRFGEVAEAFRGDALQMLAFSFLLTGFAFKISVVPFHLWTADVYEGAPVPVTSFLSVVSKGAALFIFITALYKMFGQISESWTMALMVLSAVTMTIGNFFAIRQNNIKRFLAFSSITQAGYILIGVAAGTEASMASVIYFVLIYIFSNLAAFTVVSVISIRTGKEEIGDYNGLHKTNPLLSLALLLALFSLAGIPPTAGFFGKLFLMISGASKGMIALVIIASLNMVISLYYYLRVVKAMYIDKNEQPIEWLKSSATEKTGLVICVAGILVTGLLSVIYEYIQALSFGVQ